MEVDIPVAVAMDSSSNGTSSYEAVVELLNRDMSTQIGDSTVSFTISKPNIPDQNVQSKPPRHPSHHVFKSMQMNDDRHRFKAASVAKAVYDSTENLDEKQNYKNGSARPVSYSREFISSTDVRGSKASLASLSLPSLGSAESSVSLQDPRHDIQEKNDAESSSQQSAHKIQEQNQIDNQNLFQNASFEAKVGQMVQYLDPETNKVANTEANMLTSFKGKDNFG